MKKKTLRYAAHKFRFAMGEVLMPLCSIVEGRLCSVEVFRAEAEAISFLAGSLILLPAGTDANEDEVAAVKRCSATEMQRMLAEASPGEYVLWHKATTNSPARLIAKLKL